MELTSLWESLPAAAAIIFVVCKFLQALKEQREGFSTTLNNHLQHNTDAIEKNTKMSSELMSVVKELCIYIKGLNGNSKKHAKKSK